MSLIGVFAAILLLIIPDLQAGSSDPGIPDLCAGAGAEQWLFLHGPDHEPLCHLSGQLYRQICPGVCDQRPVWQSDGRNTAGFGLSRMIGKLFGDKNAAYGALVVTAILSYGGISAFVIVFTVYPIFLATFKRQIFRES